VSPETDKVGEFLGLPETRVARNVSRPTLTPYLPHDGSGTAVIVAPGGAFHFLSMTYEGTTVAELLRDRGVAAFLLKYRLADTGTTPEDFAAALSALSARAAGQPVSSSTTDQEAHLRAFADGRRAVWLLREQASDWAIDRSRIGFLGFSAGAFVATAAALSEDPLERPDFVAPIYGGAAIRPVPADAPPWFCAVAADDALCLDTCLDGFAAWRAAGVPAELHLYERGGHGFGTRPQGLPVDGWSDRFLEWMQSRQLL
jgi:acetyl esterase/lipase